MDFYYSVGEGYDVGYVGDEVNETFAYSLHSHDGVYEILYMEEGNASFWVEGTVYKMSNGDLVIARSDEMHQMRHNAKGFYKRLVVNVSEEFFTSNNCNGYRRIFDERAVGTGNYFNADALKKNGLSDIIDRLKRYIMIDEKLLVKSALIELIYTLNNLPESSHEESGIIRDVVIYINENIASQITLELLAEQFYISKYYLCRQFKKMMGIGINRYIVHKRIMLVKELYQSGKNLTDACITAGFGDYSSFYVAYKKLYGTSPKNILR